MSRVDLRFIDFVLKHEKLCMRRLNSDEIVTLNTRILRSLRNAAHETVMYE